jgi:hypothetical protein
MDAEQMAEALVKSDDVGLFDESFLSRDSLCRHLAARLAKLLVARDQAAIGAKAPLTAEELTEWRRLAKTDAAREAFWMPKVLRLCGMIDYLNRLIVALANDSDAYQAGYRAGHHAGVESTKKINSRLFPSAL